MKEENKDLVVMQRPVVQKFVREIHQEVCASYGNVPFELVARLIYPGMRYLSLQQKNALIGLLRGNYSTRKIAEKYHIRRQTLQNLLKRSKKKLKLFIFSYLEAEKLILQIKRMQYARR